MSRTRVSFRGKVAVVTGAGSGIGRQLALGLARRGARLALADVDDAGLAASADMVKALGADVHTAHIDVSDRQAVENHAAAVAEHYGVVHQVYNNAGIATSATVLESQWDVYERVLAVNLWGVLHGTRAFLPYLIASGDGHVVNVSSINGILGQPSISAYCASKFAVRGFTEALRGEMTAAGHPVRVTVVHPGGVKTNIANASLARAEAAGQEISPEQRERVRTYNDRVLRMPAEKAAEIILDGVAACKGRILVGRDAKAIDLLVRLLPAHAPRLAVWVDQRISGAESGSQPAE
jgi:NAD(P)-dependent dehydrogenase (short-subunit alcohol dehydrogenase family)